MKFTIRKILLWPKNNDLAIREVLFVNEKVNVITGGSGRGKSALISIVDYCLASSKIRIPTGLIREKTAWFGILIQFNEREILLCRKLNDLTYELSNEMYKAEGKKIDIPLQLETNINADDVKRMLNKVLDYADIDLDTNAKLNSWEAQRPSFRNAISLNFQPQYIIANPSTLYYKADSTADREKLRILFPYLIGAIDNEVLELKEELKVLRREVQLLIKELKDKDDLAQSETSELKNYFNLAKELGLLETPSSDTDNLKRSEYKEYLERVQESYNDDRIPFITLGITDEIANAISTLRDREYDFTIRLSTLRERLFSIKNLNKSAIEYRKSLLTQTSRTKTTGWFVEAIKERDSCPFCGTEQDASRDYVKNIEAVNQSLVGLSEQVEDSVKVYSSEVSRLQNQISNVELELNKIRSELIEYEERDAEFKRSRQAITNVFRFLGRIDQVLSNMDVEKERQELLTKIDKKNERIQEIERLTKDDLSEQRKKFALDRIGENLRVYADILQPEKLTSVISLDLENLSLKFTNNTGTVDYLWEIGSGRNFMAYHICTMLALHEYLQTLSDSKVPSFIFLDQPSQVYFPEITDDKKQLAQEDVEELKKMFKALNEFIIRTKGRVQVVLLEHASENTWKEFSNIVKRYRWREEEEDHALIPDSWY